MYYRAAHRGGQVRLNSVQAFSSSLSLAQVRIAQVIASKVDDFFELAEINWTPSARRPTGVPATYVDEMISFLTSFVDAVLVAMSEGVQRLTYRRAVEHIAATFMVRVHSSFSHAPSGTDNLVLCRTGSRGRTSPS